MALSQLVSHYPYLFILTMRLGPHYYFMTLNFFWSLIYRSQKGKSQHVTRTRRVRLNMVTATMWHARIYAEYGTTDRVRGRENVAMRYIDL